MVLINRIDENRLLEERTEAVERNLRVIHVLWQLSQQTDGEILDEWYLTNSPLIEQADALWQAHKPGANESLAHSTADLTRIILDSLVELAERETTTQA